MNRQRLGLVEYTHPFLDYVIISPIFEWKKYKKRYTNYDKKLLVS